MDIVGLRTVLAVGRAQGNKEEWQDKFSSILEEMIAAGHIGVESGQGFYTYDK